MYIYGMWEIETKMHLWLSKDFSLTSEGMWLCRMVEFQHCSKTGKQTDPKQSGYSSRC